MQWRTLGLRPFGTHAIVGWVIPISDLNAVEERNFSEPVENPILFYL